MTRLVSCIIPVYNGERFVGEAIASVLAQSHQPVEVIVVDDGSTDATADVVRAFGSSVQYIPQPNAGPPAARNVGIRAARGEFIGFLDADDRWLPDKVARQLARFDAEPELGCCLTLVRLFWDDANSAEEMAYRAKGQIEVETQQQSSMLVRRAVFDSVGLFDPDLPHAALVEWFERAQVHGMRTGRVSEVVAERRMHDANFSRRESSRDEILRLVKRRLDERRASPSRS